MRKQLITIKYYVLPLELELLKILTQYAIIIAMFCFRRSYNEKHNDNECVVMCVNANNDFLWMW